MFERLRWALVESFVGAIALGYLFAQGVLHFVSIFAAPVQGWVTGNELRRMMPGTIASPGFPLRNALPELMEFLVLLLVWYVLMRWLYFNPFKKETLGPGSSPEQAE
jgi:hypothetical protein